MRRSLGKPPRPAYNLLTGLAWNPQSGLGGRSKGWQGVGGEQPREEREMQDALCTWAVSAPPLKDVSEGPGGQLGGLAGAGEMF